MRHARIPAVLFLAAAIAVLPGAVLAEGLLDDAMTQVSDTASSATATVDEATGATVDAAAEVVASAPGETTAPVTDPVTSIPADVLEQLPPDVVEAITGAPTQTVVDPVEGVVEDPGEGDEGGGDDTAGEDAAEGTEETGSPDAVEGTAPEDASGRDAGDAEHVPEAATPARSYGDTLRRGTAAAAKRALELVRPLAPPLALMAIAIVIVLALGRPPGSMVKVQRAVWSPSGRSYRL